MEREEMRDAKAGKTAMDINSAHVRALRQLFLLYAH